MKMSKIVNGSAVSVLLSALVFFPACHLGSSGKTNGEREYIITNDDSKNEKMSIIQMIDTPVFNIGTLTAGQKVKHVFRFRNIGKGPLVIFSATATCGCTVADYSKSPVLVNNEDSITAYFDSGLSGKGLLNKVVTVMSNSRTSPDLLTLIGNVK
ncbi:MAG: DUF1573 domain-containing protein [Puia sp.]|nr:DUF1573 domain-containing protein [Puia sp.]